MLYIKSDKGLAMPIVLVLIAIMLLLGITIVSVIDFDSKTVQNLSSSEDALHIAEAGYNKFLWLLNDDTYFYKNGQNTDQGFVIESTYTASENPSWQGFTKTYKMSEYKSGSKLLGYFQVKITPPSVDNPVVGVQSTGWTADGTSQRTIYVEIHKRSFSQYIMFEGSEGTSAPFGSSTKIKGPYFTNGDLYANAGAEFFDKTGYAELNRAANATFKMPGQPVKMSPLQMPAVNNELKDRATSTYTFNGDTSILLNNNMLRIRDSSSKIHNLSHPPGGVVYVTGNLYIAGVLEGRLTIVAGGNIYICAKDPTNTSLSTQALYNAAHNYGGITYKNTSIPTYDNGKNVTNMSQDMLGLVTDYDILIHNRTSSWPIANNGDILTAVPNIKVHAALYCRDLGTQDVSFLRSKRLALSHINFLGSRVVRRNNPATSSGGYGYASENVFDYRMSYDAPPHFIEPINAGWEVVSWKEVPNPTPTP